MVCVKVSNISPIVKADNMQAEKLLEKAEQLRREARFGEAMNAFREAASAPDASEELRQKCLASVELIQEINGFVNVDLLNP